MTQILTSLFGIETAYAQVTAVSGFVGRVNKYVLNPLIILMFAAALAYFLYGVMVFISNSDKPAEREDGQRHMIWGVVGLCIMFGVSVILHIIMNTLGGGASNNYLPQ